MIEIKFIKDHPVGIAKGSVHAFSDAVAEKHIEDGFAESTGKNLSGDDGGTKPEPELIDYTVTEADIKSKRFADMPDMKGLKAGEVIAIKNPKFKA